MRFAATLIALVSLAFSAGNAKAQPPEQSDRPKNKAAQSRRTQDRDPAQMVARLMQEFDKDGDQKLDVQELTAALTFMKNRRSGSDRPGSAQRTQQGQRGPRNSPGGRKGTNGKQGRGDKAGVPGGAKPKRPEKN